MLSARRGLGSWGPADFGDKTSIDRASGLRPYPLCKIPKMHSPGT